MANTTPGPRRDRLLQRVFVKTLPPLSQRPFMVAGSEERKEFLDVMQAEVFPYLPPSVLAEVGDRQRLRMLTARIGSAEDLVKLNRVLRQPSRTARASCPRTPSAPISTGSLVQKTARSEAPRLASPRGYARCRYPTNG